MTYTWDARNQLQSLSGAVTASFAYDGAGRRIGKTIGGTTTGYVYDGLNFVQEKNGTGGAAAPTANVITGLSLDETFERMTGTGASAVLSHFLPDANNNAIRLLNGAQTVTDTYSYEAYGRTTQTGSNGNTQQYTGRENDATGLYFYRTRYYHPTASRFVSEDPIEFGAGPNLYAYVDGDPISSRDPTGELAFIPAAKFLWWAGWTAWSAWEAYQASIDYNRSKYCRPNVDGPNTAGDGRTPGQMPNPAINVGRHYWESVPPIVATTALAAAATRGLGGALGTAAIVLGAGLYGSFEPCDCP